MKDDGSTGLLKSSVRSVQKSPGTKKEEEDEEERLKKIEEAERKKYGVHTIFYKIKIWRKNHIYRGIGYGKNTSMKHKNPYLIKQWRS